MALPPRHERVPDVFLAERKPDESFKRYKDRQKSNEKFLQDYLDGYPMDANAMPSQRVLKRLFEGKRSVSSLKPKERSRLHVVFGLEEDDLDRLVWFGTQTEIVENSEKYEA